MTYRTIVVDPPWEYVEPFASYSGTRRSGRPLPYPSLPVSAIAALPVRQLAAADCWLWLWTTNRYMPAAFGILPRWGFSYEATAIWHKTGGVSPFSQSRISLLTDAEFLIAASAGKPLSDTKLPSLVIEANRTGDHSRKPDAFQDYIEACCPGPYLELFARRQRLGWDTWGDEALCHIELAAAPA